MDSEMDEDFEVVKPKPVARKPVAPKPAATLALAPKPAMVAKPKAAPAVAPPAAAPVAPAKPAESEPLSLAARLAGRFQQLTVKPATSGTAAADAALPPPAGPTATFEFDDEDITSPAPAAVKARSKVAGAARPQVWGRHDCLVLPSIGQACLINGW